MKAMALAIIVICITFVSGCATVTPYQSEQYGGGYIDVPMSDGRYKISVRGNGYTDRQRVFNIALVRAAEIAIQKGKSHFLVMDSGENEKNRTEFTGQYVMNVKNHYVSLIIKPTNEATLDGAIDARAKIHELGPLVGYTGIFR